MKRLSLPLTLLLLASIVLAACTPSAPEATPTIPVEAMVATSAAQTVEALTTQLAQQPTNTVEVIPTDTPEPTNTQPAEPTNTAPVILQPTNTSVVVATQAPVCDKAQFVADVTVPDGATFKGGEAFTKTWRLKNIGTCTWDTNYKLVFDSGNSLEGPATVNLPSSVAPGQTVDISVNLKAPASNGTYTGYYKLQNASGTKFGVGGTGQEAFWVKIVVGTASGTTTPGPSQTPGGPTATATLFAVRVEFRVSTTDYVGACPQTINVEAHMTSTRAGDTESYFILDGVAQPSFTKSYDKAETHGFTLPVNVTESRDYKIEFRNVKPNNQTFGPLTIKVTCTP